VGKLEHHVARNSLYAEPRVVVTTVKQGVAMDWTYSEVEAHR
jgi:hypothetical protein